jgi:deaminated glutathione amidase
MTVFAAIQMVSGADVTGNLCAAEALIHDAARQRGAKVIVLPENFAHMGLSDTDKLNIAEANGTGPIQSFLAQQAQQLGVWLIAGTVPLMGSLPNKVRAACLVYDPEGRCVTRYDKIHLFDVTLPGREESYRESSTIEAGSYPMVVETPYAKLGLSICYDVRFPELYRILVGRGAEVILVPSAFTAATGQAHWEALLRARAIENQCYIVAPNQGGQHPSGRRTHGHSMIIDPWGTIMAHSQQGPDVVVAQLDLTKLHDTRRQFPVLQHRRFAVSAQL